MNRVKTLMHNTCMGALHKSCTQMKVDIVNSIKGRLLVKNAKICNFEKNLIKGS